MLEFNQLVEQVYRMGAMLEKLDFNIAEAMNLALQRFDTVAADMERVWERIHWVRQPDIRGYRGAAPLDMPNAEPINQTYAEPPMPARATIIAADGSQIYPEEQAPLHYYLINIGVFVYHHGIEATPEQYTYPDLRYHKDHVHERSGQIISNRTVDDRRTIAEMKYLADAAWQRREDTHPILSLYDNRLMFLPSSDLGTGNDPLAAYFSALVHLHDAKALLAGYIDNPIRSKRFIQLLYLLSFENEADAKTHQQALSRGGDLDGLRDYQLFDVVLQPGERSAIMVQNSPQNKAFRDRGINYEIAFFYLKVDNGYMSRIVRVDIPAWVARDRLRVDAIHALILSQCRLQGRNPYPYALTRADELAWVSSQDRAKLTELINVQVRRVKQDLVGRTLPPKVRGKEIARSRKRYFDIWGEEVIDDK